MKSRLKITDISLNRISELEKKYLEKYSQSNSLPSLAEINLSDENDINIALLDRYGYEVANPSKTPKAWVLGSPGFLYLNKKRKALLNAALSSSEEEKVEVEDPPLSFFEKLSKYTIQFLDTFKKVADLVDDVLNALRNANILASLSDIVLRGIIGGIGLFIQSYEAYMGAFDAYAALNEEQAEHKGIRVLVGSLKCLWGLAGIGVVSAYLLSKAISTPVSLFCTSILLLANFSAELGKRIHIFSEAAKDEDEKKEKLVKTSKGVEANRDIYKSYRSMVFESALENDNDDKLIEKFNGLGVFKRSLKKIFEPKQALQKKQFKKARQETLDAEREVGFAATEVATGAIVVSSMSAGLAAVMLTGLTALTISTLGTAAFALTVIGVVAGTALKIFQAVDDYYAHKPTETIRNFFRPQKETKAMNKNRMTVEIENGLKRGENSTHLLLGAEGLNGKKRSKRQDTPLEQVIDFQLDETDYSSDENLLLGFSTTSGDEKTDLLNTRNCTLSGLRL